MPTCPACGSTVGYDELRTHLGTCKFVWSDAPRRTDRLTRHLAARLRLLAEDRQVVDASQADTNPEDDDQARADEPSKESHKLP